jgi:Signal transduction histidine kinase
VDEENRLIYHNHLAAQLLGIAPQTKKRQTLLKWVRCYELDQLVSQTRTQNKNLVQDWEWQIVVPDPENPLPQPSRALRGHSIKLGRGQVGVFLENRQEVNALRQHCDRWTSDLAHELKTPLTSIRLLAETLQPRIDHTARDWLDRLLNEIIRLSTLVQDLLDLNQAQMGRIPQIKLQPVHLQELIDSVWHSLEPIASKRKVQLVTQLPAECTLSGDPTRLYRLFLNLLDNAIKHSPSQQQIMVQADQDSTGANLVIDVIDCGDGFPEAAIPHVFERFYRADPARCWYGSEGGSGLGLAIAKQIVQLHRGSISVMNHPETGGGQVRVSLPLDRLKLNHAGH